MSVTIFIPRDKVIHVVPRGMFCSIGPSLEWFDNNKLRLPEDTNGKGWLSHLVPWQFCEPSDFYKEQS